jgi:hypothetical protein
MKTGTKRNTLHWPEPHCYPTQRLADDSNLSATKAGKMLEDNSAQGHPLTGKQKRYFGWVKGGRKPRKTPQY